MVYESSPVNQKMKLFYLVLFTFGIALILQWVFLYYIPFLTDVYKTNRFEIIRWELLLSIFGTILNLAMCILYFVPEKWKNILKLKRKKLSLINFFIAVFGGLCLVTIGFLLHWSWLIYFLVLCGLWAYFSLMSYTMFNDEAKALEEKWIIRNCMVILIIFSAKWIMPEGKLFYSIAIKGESVPVSVISFSILAFILAEIIIWTSQFLFFPSLADDDL